MERAKERMLWHKLFHGLQLAPAKVQKEVGGGAGRLFREAEAGTQKPQAGKPAQRPQEQRSQESEPGGIPSQFGWPRTPCPDPCPAPPAQAHAAFHHLPAPIPIPIPSCHALCSTGLWLSGASSSSSLKPRAPHCACSTLPTLPVHAGMQPPFLQLPSPGSDAHPVHSAGRSTLHIG